MSIDSIGNFITIIRNGVIAAKPFVNAPYSRMRNAIAQILMNEGFIKGFEVEENEIKALKIYLKYVDGESVIHEIMRKSRPGRRYYAGTKNIKPVIDGLGISILTTNKGVITSHEAKKIGVGGEVICTVW